MFIFTSVPALSEGLVICNIQKVSIGGRRRRRTGGGRRTIMSQGCTNDAAIHPPVPISLLIGPYKNYRMKTCPLRDVPH